MTRGIYTKWIIGAVFMLLIVATGCILYYQHTTAADKHAAAQAEKRLETWQADKAKPPTPAKTESTKPPVESTTPTAEAETEQTSTPTDTDEVLLSKFGFGPYPEVPADFPWQEVFGPSYNRSNADYELMDRVSVELWKQGEHVEGISSEDDTGLFYPTIRGTIYVEWGSRWEVLGKGFGRKVRGLTGHPDDLKSLQDLIQSREGSPLLESDIPSHLKVLDMSEGIDPYKFLDLPK